MSLVPSVRSRSIVAALILLAIALAALTPGSAGARPDAKAELSPVAFDVLYPPTPVRGADGKMHLAYELQVNNLAPFAITITKVGPRAQNNVLGKALTGTALAARTRLNDGSMGATLGPGAGAMIIMDAAYSPGRKPPRKISHGIGLAWTDPSTLETRTMRFAGVGSKVRRRPAIKVASPLRGGKWVAASGCCTLNPHRGATLAIDGTVRAPERFAIDFVQMNSENRLFSGPISELSSYEFFGAKIHAARGGRVVRVRDGLPEQVPGTTPANPTIQMAGGNHVVVRMDKGRYALFAHLKTGSVRVKRGQKVKAGQVLGLLGNTGNTDSPHLHFHVMDGPSPLQSNGLPYTFRRFNGQGFINDVNRLITGEDPGITRRLLGPHRNQLTLDNQIVNFGD
ncbi:MAG: M23 family metallopeptidase [Actinomycetota bacterium]|nr:M23 family metallopeptidase [Actinomycetota bacterium]